MKTNFYVFLIISFASLVTWNLIPQPSFGQLNESKYMNEDEVNTILGYCYLHADRPNPVQDLVDKGLVSADFAGDTCASVKQGSEDARKTKGHEEFARQASDAYNQCLQEKTLSDCWDIISNYCDTPAYAPFIDACKR